MKALQAVSSASLILLIFVCLVWELWLAAIRPGSSWLLLPLMGILKGRRYT